jgi:hypothetical protein
VSDFDHLACQRNPPFVKCTQRHYI